MKTLICLRGDIRATDLCWNSFYNNVMKRWNADLCLATSKGQNTIFHNHAKYIWEYEYDNFSVALDEASKNSSDKNWRQLLNIPTIWMGGTPNGQCGSGAILHFISWFLLKNLQKHNIFEQYDRFAVTRSDFFYLCPHILIEETKFDKIYFPDGENYGGICDRQFIANAQNTEKILSFSEEVVFCPSLLYKKMTACGKERWNTEQFLLWQLKQHDMEDLIVRIPYIMFLVKEQEENCFILASPYYEPSVNMIVRYKSEFNTATGNYKKRILYF